MNIKSNNNNENKGNNSAIKRANKNEENKDYNYPAIYILSPNLNNWQIKFCKILSKKKRNYIT